MTSKPSSLPGLPDILPLTSIFNDRAENAREIEIKYLVPDRNLASFDRVESFFRSRGLIISETKNYHLLTRQLDTANMALAKRGASIRVRGECPDGTLDSVVKSDICIKAGKTLDPSGAIQRGEYESRIPDFKWPSMKEVKAKYPARTNAELHNVLKGIAECDLKEYFRIDCMRHRYLINLPESMSGLSNKRFVSELLCDDVCFVLDVPGMADPIVFHHDLEIESEIMFKPCSYDRNSDAVQHVSSPMTVIERNESMKRMGDLIVEASGLSLLLNMDSKAERGFEALRKLSGHMSALLPETKPKKLIEIIPALFAAPQDTANANSNTTYIPMNGRAIARSSIRTSLSATPEARVG